MASRNITLRLDEETIKKARVVAAMRGSSVSRLITETLEEIVGSNDVYEVARRTALGLLQKPPRLGGKIRVRRDQWHER